MHLKSSDSAARAALLQVTRIRNIEDWLMGTLNIFRKQDDCRNHGNNAPEPPILAIQGTAARTGVMRPIHRAFRDKSNTYSVDLGFTMGDIPKMAAKVGEKIDEIQKIEPNGGLRVIAHSLGTLLALEAIKQESRRHIEMLIALAPPFQGSKMARPILWSKSCRQLVPKSSYLREFNDWFGNENITPLQIHRAGRDYFVPPKHQIPEHPGKGLLQIIEQPKFGHASFFRGTKGTKFITELRNHIRDMIQALSKAA